MLQLSPAQPQRFLKPPLVFRLLLSALHDLWSDKSGDTEITLQLLLTLWWLLHTKESREEVSKLARWL